MVSGSSSDYERGGGVNGRPSRRFTYTELFEKMCPLYMAMGMTPEQFWDGDCELVRYYRKLDEINQERRNEFAWQTGLYFCEALASVLSFKKKIKYPSEPHPLKTSISAKKQDAKRREQEREAMLLERERWINFAKQFNKRFEAKQKAKTNPEQEGVKIDGR